MYIVHCTCKLIQPLHISKYQIFQYQYSLFKVKTNFNRLVLVRTYWRICWKTNTLVYIEEVKTVIKVDEEEKKTKEAARKRKEDEAG